MPNKFVKTTKTGFGSRLWGSITGILIGILLFVVSFGVLYWNEGRVDVSEIAKNAVEIDALKASGSVDAEADGELVYVSGEVVSDEQIGDGLYLVPGEYLAVQRMVEIYSWVEETESTTDENWGGSETTETTYNYVEDWVSDPAESRSFEYSEGHENPAKGVADYDGRVGSAKIGVYDLDMQALTLPGFEALSLNEEVVDLGEDWEAELVGGYVFIGYGNLTSPEVGDLRISYSVLRNGANGTVFAELDGGKLATYVDESTDESLYRMFGGTRNEALGTMHGEYNMMLWVFRLIGFLMMWIGLSSLFKPVTVILSIVPAFGSLSRGIIGVITFVVAAVLSVVTVVISMILHSIIALIVAVVIVALIILYILKRKGQKPNVVRV